MTKPKDHNYQAGAPLGDKHNGMQTRLIVDGDSEYIYKPRNADTERAWKGFLNMLRSAGFPHTPGYVEILSDNGSEHTEERILHTPTLTKDLPEYYAKCGALVFFAYLFGSYDLHEENLIACGGVPVPIDLETLMCGVTERMPERVFSSLAWSVFRSHLLPQFDGKTDISGISGTDYDGSNLPVCEDGVPFAADYTADICRGFEEAYRFAMEHRELLHRGIQGFSNCRFRVLLRPSDTYGRISQILTAVKPEQRAYYARAAILRAYERDLDPDRPAKTAALIREETEAVLRNEIPLFDTVGDSLDLFCRGSCVMRGFLRLSPVANSQWRLSTLSERDLQKQLKLIQLSYDATRPLAAPTDTATDKTESLDALEACIVPNHDCSFIRLASDRTGKGHFESVGWGLYDGLAGILCAYAAVWHKTRDAGILKRIEDFYLPMRAALSGQSFSLNEKCCALDAGIGGIIAALLHIGRLTNRERFAEDAIALAGNILPEVKAGLKADLLNGAGGLALQLPKLPAALARPLAEALLPVIRDAEPKLTGLAHGAAGQALCLGALQRGLPEQDLTGRILELLRWEDGLFDAEEGNWPDLRNGKTSDFMGGWCSGAPGVGLARMQLLNYVGDPEIERICRTDIARAAAWLEKAPPGRRDTLCCGNAARLVAAVRLGAESAPFRRSLSGSLRPDSPRLFHMLDTADRNVGLMQGLGGVLYALALCDEPSIGEMLL